MTRKVAFSKEKFFDKVLRFVTLRPRSEKEIKDWFKRKNIPDNTAEELFNQLKKLDFINDKDFASWWVEQRVSFHPISKAKIKFELLAKGVLREVIDDVLEKSDLDEKKLAIKLAEKRLMRLQGYTQEKKQKKLYNFLAHRGFSWNTIQEVCQKLLGVDGTKQEE